MKVEWEQLDSKKPDRQEWYPITVEGITGPRISSAYWDGNHFIKGGLVMDTFVHAWADGLEAYRGGKDGGS